LSKYLVIIVIIIIGVYLYNQKKGYVMFLSRLKDFQRNPHWNIANIYVLSNDFTKKEYFEK